MIPEINNFLAVGVSNPGNKSEIVNLSKKSFEWVPKMEARRSTNP